MGEAEDEDDGEEGGKESSPAKKAKTIEAQPYVKKSPAAKAGAPVDADVLARAKTEGLAVKMKTLMDRPEIQQKGIGAAAVLKALQDASGKTIVAKKALLAA